MWLLFRSVTSSRKIGRHLVEHQNRQGLLLRRQQHQILQRRRDLKEQRGAGRNVECVQAKQIGHAVQDNQTQFVVVVLVS